MKKLFSVALLLCSLGLMQVEAQVCEKPSGLKILGLNQSSVSLAWNIVPGASLYTLEVMGERVPYFFTETFPPPPFGTQIVYPISELLPCTKYKFRVRATCGTTLGPWTNYRHLRTICGR